MKPDAADGTYSLAEIAPIVGIPEGTLFRWRWQGYLLTTYDFLVDKRLAQHIQAADRAKSWLRGPMPLARFNLEDCTRLCVVGYLGMLGWDRQRLLKILARPFALPNETRGDGHTPVDWRNMPAYLLLFVEGQRFTRQAFDVIEEVIPALLRYPAATVVHLDSFRDAARAELAKVELAREQRVARHAEAELETV